MLHLYFKQRYILLINNASHTLRYRLFKEQGRFCEQQFQSRYEQVSKTESTQTGM